MLLWHCSDVLLNDHIRRHTIVSDDIGKLDTFNETLKTQNITVHNRQHYPLICDRVGKFYGEVIGVERFSLALNKYVVKRHCEVIDFSLILFYFICLQKRNLWYNWCKW